MNKEITVDGVEYTLGNAIIKSTHLGFEDHGIMTFWLNLEYSSCTGQRAGGYSIDGSKGMDLITKILTIVGVKSWEELPGKYIRVYSTHIGVGAIFNILEDRGVWFKKHFEEAE
ncbi:MAG: hypothetical protein PHS80_00395 [Methanothrix sp.]|nr:hypothetical protein [Bacteroidales bacterium]MDD2753960.1 hypothetical protein [Methanothrix sp.]